MSRTDKASGCHQPASPCSLPVSGGAGGDLLLSTPEFVGGRVSSVHFKGCQKISKNKLLFQSGHRDNERPPSSFPCILLIDVGSCVLTWISTVCLCVCVCVCVPCWITCCIKWYILSARHLVH